MIGTGCSVCSGAGVQGFPTFAKPPSELALGMVAWEKDRRYWRDGIAGAAELPCEQAECPEGQSAPLGPCLPYMMLRCCPCLTISQANDEL